MSLASVSPDRYQNQMKMWSGIETKLYAVDTFMRPNKKEITVDAENLSASKQNEDLDLPHEDSEIKIIDNNQIENLRPTNANSSNNITKMAQSPKPKEVVPPRKIIIK